MSEALIDIEVDRRTADRLNAVSARRRYFPFADEIIDWSVPLSDDWSYMPDGTPCCRARGCSNGSPRRSAASWSGGR